MPPVFSELLGDREYISQYAVQDVGILIHKNGVLADADANDVRLTMESLDGITVLFTDRAATREAEGTYAVTIQSAESATPGVWKLTWTFDLDAVAQSMVVLLEVGLASPDYDALADGFKLVVETTWVRFADLFDSPNGGPHLQVYFQSRFTRGRMAQLLRVAVNRLNSIAQPHQSYTIDGTKPFPFAKWGGLLEQSLYVEAVKHLIRSYVEQPDALGVNIARLNRRDYMDRWQTVLNMEQADLKQMLDVFKIANMGLGRPRVLVSGGVYGEFGPTRLPMSAAARPRFWWRFY